MLCLTTADLNNNNTEFSVVGWVEYSNYPDYNCGLGWFVFLDIATDINIRLQGEKKLVKRDVQISGNTISASRTAGNTPHTSVT